jgi:hypothetical protein
VKSVVGKPKNCGVEQPHRLHPFRFLRSEVIVESSPNRTVPALARGFDGLRRVEQRAATTPAKLQPQFAVRAEAHEFKRVVVWLAIN